MNVPALKTPRRRTAVIATLGIAAVLTVTGGVWASSGEDREPADQTQSQPTVIAPDVSAHQKARNDLEAKITATQEFLAGVGDRVLDAEVKTDLESQVVAARSLIDATATAADATQADVDLATTQLLEALAAFEPMTLAVQTSHDAFLARAAESQAAPAPKASTSPGASSKPAAGAGAPPTAPRPAAPLGPPPPHPIVNCLAFVGNGNGSPPPPGVHASYFISGDRSAPYTIVITVAGGGSQTVTVPAGVSSGSLRFPDVAFTGPGQCSVKPG